MSGTNEYHAFILVVACFAAVFGVLMVILHPLLHRRSRRRAQAELQEKVRKAKEHILEDGIVEGPKGPYVPHKKWNAPANVNGSPKFKGPYGPST